MSIERTFGVGNLAVSMVLLIGLGAAAARQQKLDRIDRSLFEAIYDGNSVSVFRSLEAGASANARNREEAIPRSFWQIVRDIFTGKPNGKGTGEAAIQSAIRVGNPHIVRLLLDSGARTNVKFGCGQSLMKHAQFYTDMPNNWCSYGRQIEKHMGVNHKEVLALLIARGLKVGPSGDGSLWHFCWPKH